ncbi:hypothetical protein GCM10010182_02070 [Actinomadura cremea]|nr:hypothetical protein GCM10010182_02070 [Actinomadura cremea]
MRKSAPALGSSGPSGGNGHLPASIRDSDAEGPSTWHALGGVPVGDAVDRLGRAF